MNHIYGNYCICWDFSWNHCYLPVFITDWLYYIVCYSMIWIFMNKTQEISNIDMKCKLNNDSINRIKPMKFHRTQGLSFGSQGPGQERDLRLVLFVVLHPKSADPEATAGDPSGSFGQWYDSLVIIANWKIITKSSFLIGKIRSIMCFCSLSPMNRSFVHSYVK